MSKRIAGNQITREREGDDEQNERDRIDPVEEASAEVLAKRKIAQPKSRRKAGASTGEEGSSGASTPAVNPFAKLGGDDASAGTETVKANPFASLTTTSADKPTANAFGSISTKPTFSFNAATPAFSFGASAGTAQAPEAASSTPAFSFGANQSAAASSSFAIGANKPLEAAEEMAATDANTVDTGKGDSSKAESAIESDEYKRLLRARSLNVAFQQAIGKILDGDIFADLSVVAKEYLSYMEEKADASEKSTNAKVDSQKPYPEIQHSEEAAPKLAATAFEFGQSSNGAAKPASTFAYPPKEAVTEPSTSKEADKAPVFNFKPSESVATPKKTAEGGKNFSWTPDKGVKFSNGNDEASAKLASSAFSFTNPLAMPANADKDDATKQATAFQFNKPSTGFSFGQGSEPPAGSSSKTPTFNFASTGSSSSMFGSAPAPSSNATPTFTFGFGAKPADTRSETVSAAENVAKEKQGEAQGEAEEDGDNMPEEPRTNDALIAQGAGEEDEEALWQQDGRVYKWVEQPDDAEEQSRFVDKGKCNIKLNKHKSTGKCRIIARAEGAGSIRLNARLYAHFRYTFEGSPKGKSASVKVSVMGDDSKVESWLVRVRDPAQAQSLADLLNEHKKS
jgi:hypothetical protein